MHVMFMLILFVIYLERREVAKRGRGDGNEEKKRERDSVPFKNTERKGNNAAQNSVLSHETYTCN